MSRRNSWTYHEPQGRPVRSETTIKTIESINDYVPNARQKVFHQASADVVGYGGAAGGGKSLALLAEAWGIARETPGAHVMMMRRTFPELEASLILESFKLFPHSLARYNEIKHRWIIKSKGGGRDSIIQYGFCKGEDDVFQYQSAQWLALFLDEATHFTWTQVSYLMTRVRTTIPGAWARIRMGTNPGNVGHWWFKKYFGIRPKDPGWIPEKVFTPEPEAGFDEAPMSRCFVPARIFDNKALVENDPTYLKRLMLLPSALRAQLLEGSWESFEGKFFTELTPAHFVKRFSIPDHWKFYRAVDYGYSSPFCCLWITAAPDGHFYVFRERYAAKLRDFEQARLIRQATPERAIEYTTGDASMKAKNASGTSPMENYMIEGVALVPASRELEAGWMAVRNYLSEHPDKTPILRIVEEECPNLKRELEDAITDPKNTDIVNTEISDHAIDALRYFCVGRPIIPKEKEPEQYMNLDDLSRREWIAVTKAQNAALFNKDKAILNGVNSDMNEEDQFWRD